MFNIAHSEKFPYELGNVPKSVRKACMRWQEQVINNEKLPNLVDPPQIKKLNDYKGFWRARISDDYRLVYHIDTKEKLVTMLMVDHRNRIYERLGLGADGKPGIRIVAQAETLFEVSLASAEIERAEISLRNNEYQTSKPEPTSDLSAMLTIEILKELNVPEQFIDCLCQLKTDDELLSADNIPDEVKERIMYYFWPTNVEEVMQKPVRIAAQPADLEDAADGKRPLESFLLKLDEEQKEFVTRFKSDSKPVGPWLLKGGPGSGKSTITLYCIKSLLDSLFQQEGLFEKARPFRILYTTYTNSLVRVSKHLLNELEAYNSPHSLTVNTVDSMASSYLPIELGRLKLCKSNEDFEEIIKVAIENCRDKVKQFSFNKSDKKFLVEEIDWVIIGQDLNSADDYLVVDRTGRGRALGKQQRLHLWNLYEEFIDLLRQKDMCLFSERLRYAANHVTPDYDYVFIDEAQDLKPVAIRFLMGLCNNRKNVYLTADINQSIWGYSFSWKKMSEDLDVRGRAKVLRRNYRTVKEIWDAIMQIAPNSDTADQETLQVDTVYRGEAPILAWYDNQNQIKERLNTFLFEALREERTTPKSAAVLCPTAKEAEYVYNMIDPKYKPKIMKSAEVDITWPGVKILTMHAAKGLEFPVVAVVGLEQGRLPLPAMAGIDRSEHYAQQQRLFFVACSRAMRRLIVFACKDRPSPFVKNLTDEKWEFEHLDMVY